MKTFLTPAFLLTVLSLSAACGDDTTGTGGAGSGSGGSDGGSGPTSSSTTAAGPTSTSGSSSVGSSSGGGEGGSGTSSVSSGGGEGGSGTSSVSSGGGEGGSGTSSVSSGGGEGGTSSVSSGGGEGGASVSVTTGGPGDCIEITAGDFAAITNADYETTFAPATLGAETIRLEFWEDGGAFNGADIGTFDLSTGGDDNYSTCSRCFRGSTAGNFGSPYAAPQFLQSAGTLVLEATSDQLNGAVEGTVTDLTLIEVTIDPATFVSTPVANGTCLYLASAPVVAGGGVVVPPEWTCDPAWYGDSDADLICDCGCGAVDPNCADATGASCDFCADTSLGGCNEGLGCPGTIDQANNAVCTGGGVPAGWTCTDGFYGDGDCDCGCGVIDVDCAGDEAVAACDFCIAPGSGGCNTGAGCPGTIDPLDNAVCTGGGVPAAWECTDAFYGDGDCDCGCGVIDIDCGGDDSIAACDFCNGAADGGCNTGAGCPGTIDPTDNAVCTGGAVWTCNPNWIGDGDCDCGCGIQDTDCPDLLASSCDFCLGACNVSDTCPGDIDPVNNTTCN
jgi:hypothetical protein